jgi:hypothetical protein
MNLAFGSMEVMMEIAWMGQMRIARPSSVFDGVLPILLLRRLLTWVLYVKVE